MIAAFLDTTEDDDAAISSEVRIVLVSADFSREVTTTVLWLNGFEGIDIRCVRLVPYELKGSILLDIQQVLPLPEAADFQVRLRQKERDKDRARTSQRDLTRYRVIVDGDELPEENKRNAVWAMVSQLVRQGVALSEIRATLPHGRLRVRLGTESDSSQIRAALVEQGIANPGRWFVEKPLLDASTDETYVLSNQWGPNTEPTLALLAERFPDAKVTFRRATAG